MVTLTGHTQPVTNLASLGVKENGTGARVASLSSDEKARVWDIELNMYMCVATLANHTSFAFRSEMRVFGAGGRGQGCCWRRVRTVT